MGSPFAALPAIGRLLAAPEIDALPRPVAVRACRAAVADARATIAAGGRAPLDLVPAVLVRAARLRRLHIRPVINATGVVLHTGLGRAPLAPEVAAEVAAVGAAYSSAELDLETGDRGERLTGITAQLSTLVGAEAAVAVNNNAAAMLLAMSALASGREVIISRGELVEIGGSFRVPDVITAGGARLVEVGTTNRTRVGDYAAAITERTALLLRVHPSNFRQIGFVARPARSELVALGAARGLPVVEDLGSGLLGTLPGVCDEAVERCLAEGVDLACFSGDKLLGGPQAGLVAGRATLVAALRRHPLYRALRLDKMVLAGLEATMRIYLEGRADRDIPARWMLQRSEDDLAAAAEQIADALPGACVERGESVSGGGALPGQPIPTMVVALPGRAGLAARLRTGEPPIVARVHHDALLFDPRTVRTADIPSLIAGVRAALGASGS